MAETLLASGKSKKLLEGLTVVDVDVHIHDTPAQLAPYCEMPWRKSLEAMKHLPTDDYMVSLGGYSPQFDAAPPFPSGGRRQTVVTADQMRRELDLLGVNIGLLFPDYLLYLAALRNADYACTIAEAYNRWLIEKWVYAENGLKGAVVAASQDPVRAAREVRRYAAERNVVAVYLPVACVEPLLGHRVYDPIYDACEETGLPLFVHSGANTHPAFPFNVHGFETNFSVHTLTHPLSIIANLVSMIETGVVVRFPNLRIAFVEVGIAWVPWIMLRLDKEYNERRREVPFLKERPSTYIKKMYFATQPIEEPERMRDVATLIELFDGHDSVMFASDWPHHDFDHPSKILQIPLSDENRTKIMGGNAMRLLGLDEPKRDSER
jgi:predicted TIM-barrel fold metal-dependent hydrolase